MATKPRIKTLTNSSVDVLNAIRNNATTSYRDYVPVATDDAESIREIGAVIMDNPQLQNEFLSALVNRIGRVILSSKMYSNPWAMFKKGMLDFGETTEEIFINLAKPYQFDPEVAESEVFKREIPDVRSAFHIMNYQKVYKATVTQEQLRQAFLSWDGVTQLVSKIVEAMYTSANYDEFQTLKYMLARRILKGQMYVQQVTSPATDIKKTVSDIKGVSNDLIFLKNKYNLAGVYNNTLKEDQYLLINSKFEAEMNVEVLASAFNMDKAQFAGHMVLVDSFGDIDMDRLAILFADDDTYVPFTQSELQTLDEIPVILLDKDWFMFFDNLMNFTEIYNPQGLYWNYFYHAWKTFSASPFANNVLFVTATPTVTSVAVTPTALTLGAGQSTSIKATVVTTNFAPQGVKWEVTQGKATVSPSGVVTLDATASGTVKVKATSVFDSSKSATVTITVA